MWSGGRNEKARCSMSDMKQADAKHHDAVLLLQKLHQFQRGGSGDDFFDQACLHEKRGTWLNFKSRGDMAALVEGDKRLFNQYGMMFINSFKHLHVKAADGHKFLDWPIAIAAAAPGLAGCSGMEIVLLKGKFTPRPG